MARINIYDRSETGNGELLGWFNSNACTDVINEDTQWNEGVGNRVGVMSGLQAGYESLLRTAQGRWVRHYNARNEYSGPEFHEFLTDAQARTWLLKNNAEDSDKILAKYFGEPEEEAGPSKGGRPRVGEPISVAYPTELLARVDAAADAAGITRAAWLRQAASDAIETPPATLTALKAAAQLLRDYADEIDHSVDFAAENVTIRFPDLKADLIIKEREDAAAFRRKFDAVIGGLDAVGFATQTD